MIIYKHMHVGVRYVHTHSHTHLQLFQVLAPKAARFVGVICEERQADSVIVTGLRGHSKRHGGRKSLDARCQRM